MDDRDDKERLDRLDERLRAARARRAEPEQARSGSGGGGGTHFRVAVDLVAGIAGGVVIGVLLDRWLGTQPWLLLVFFVLGAAAGIRNVLRMAERPEGGPKADDRTPPKV